MRGTTRTVLLFLWGAVPVIAAQDQPAQHAAPPVPCGACHACATPTEKQPCLRPCGRTTAGGQDRVATSATGPQLVILDELEDLYLPVPFDHKGHAEMAKMTHGCVCCHHHTPAGWEHPACKTCHEISPAKEDIRKPGLKGAYHRQCLNCHREWDHATSCSICHPPKAGRSPNARAAAAPTKDDIIGLMHPPIPEPETVAYESKYAAAPGSSGTTVLFRHKDHIHRFGLQCVDCHHESNCNRCHGAQEEHGKNAKTAAEHHVPCKGCHETEDPDRCSYCHLAPQFTHEQIGWQLGQYHEKLRCRRCHIAVPFRKLPTDCNTCHERWKTGTFDHAVTGQRLDATHAPHACTECHPQRRFDQPPTCDECHDEEEGITFPQRRPGPTASR